MGESMRLLRERAGLTVEEAARRIGVGPQLLARWEDGSDEPLGRDLCRMAEAYGCSPDELLGLPQRK